MNTHTKQTILILNLILLFSIRAFSQLIPSINYNHVIEQTPREALVIIDNDFNKVQTSIKYTDGLGRPLQTVLYNAAPTGTKDILVSSATYDIFGRQQKSYLPTPSSINTGALVKNFQSVAATFYNDTIPFNRPVYEPSAANRLMKSYGVGQNWKVADKFKEMKYETNSFQEVRLYIIGLSGSITSSYYLPSTLFKNQTVSERGKNTIEFSDKSGRLIEKWVQDENIGLTPTYIKTAYIYDIFGRLAYVIPPKSYEVLQTFNENSIEFEEGIYAYKYDERGRLKRKHLPSAGWTEMIYDRQDRMVLSQNAKEKIDSTWKFTKYESFGRVIMNGLLRDSTNIDSLRAMFSRIKIPYDSLHLTNIPWKYSNQSFPIAIQNNEIKAANYYDQYNWLDNQIVYQTDPDFPDTRYNDVNSLQTGSIIRNLENDTLYYSVNFFDFKQRPIQSQATHHLGGNLPFSKTSITHYKYNFVGDILATKTTYRTKDTTDLSIRYDYTYDHMGRKKKVFHSINGIKRTLAEYIYDDIGRLKQKLLQPSFAVKGDSIIRNTLPPNYTEDIYKKYILLNPGFNITAQSNNTYLAQIGRNSIALQQIDYDYHIRGGLKCMNCDNNGNPITVNGDLFAFRLDYEDNGMFFDGNIQKQTWRSSHDSLTRSYVYNYDSANRLSSADFVGHSTEDYDLPQMTYDKNGNILSLWRNGKTATGHGRVDQLTYEYMNSNVGNRLKKVSDASINTENYSFKDGTNLGDDYEYYANGNLKKDANKDITELKYNYLDLVKEVNLTTNRKVSFEYAGDGRKLKKKTSNNEETVYLGELIFTKVNNKLRLYQISHDEGRATPDTNGYRYEYFYTDHLGNIRLAFRDSIGVSNLPVITQLNAYDAWGQMLQGIDYERNTNNKGNNFNYAGKETQNEFGIDYIDYGARMYDKSLGRWFVPDPLLELDFDQGQYNFVDNNPIKRIDLFGMIDLDGDGKDDTPNLFDEVEVKAERLPQFRSFSENQQRAYERNERLYGHPSPFRKDFQDGGALASGIILAPVAVIGAAEIGVGAFISQGASYLTRTRSLGIGRKIVRKMASGLADFTVQMIVKKGDLSKINYTSVLSNIFISNPFVSATTGTLLEVNQKEENSITPQSGNRFLDAFNGNVSFSKVAETGFNDIIIGTAGNMIGGKFASLMPLSPVQSYLGNATVNLYTEGYKVVVADKNKK